MSSEWWNNEDALDEERQRYSFEVYPENIAEQLCSKARESEGLYYWHPTEEDEEQIKDILYDLRTICCNKLNREGFRKLYKLLCVVSHEIKLERR